MSRRKKISDEFSAEDLNLKEGEKKVITETRTIETKTVSADDNEVITPDPEDETETYEGEPELEFLPDSIGGMLFGDEDDPEVMNNYCSILVRRNPDKMGDKFRVPCNTPSKCPALQNVDLHTSRDDIEENVRQRYGGGHYFFQVQYNGHLTSRKWQETLLDEPGFNPAPPQTAPVSIATEQPRAEEKPKSFIEQAQEMKVLKELLLGDDIKVMDELKRDNQSLRDEIQKMQMDAVLAKIDALSNKPPEDEFTQRIRLLETTSDDSIKGKILESLIPDKSKRSIIGEIFDHKEEIADAVKFGLNFFGNKEETTQSEIERIMGKTDATEEDSDFQPSTFKRRQTKTDSEEN